MNTLSVFFAALLGLFFGSFINCVSWRAVRGENFVTGRSRCVHCGHALGAAELIPLASWLLQKGRCRHCGARISARYPLTEALCAILFALTVWARGLSLTAARDLLLICVLLGASLSDLDGYEVPDGWWIAGCIVFVLFALPGGAGMWQRLLSGLLGGLCAAVPVLLVGIVMDKVLKKPSLGGADIKLLFMAGLFTGWKCALLLLLTSCVLGILGASVLRRAAGERAPDEAKQGYIPFVPAIALACWLCVLWGTPVIQWYLGLF